MAKTIRFQALIDRSGRPDVYTPWSDPLKDRAFQKAIKENRVLTIHQNLPGTKDYGEVGFEPDRGSQLLIFPKSLRWAESKRVVGIHYEDVAEAKFPNTPAKPRKEPRAAKHTERPVPLSGGAIEPEESQNSTKPNPAETEETETAPPVHLDPLTEQLKAVLNDLGKRRATKAKAALRKIIERREES